MGRLRRSSSDEAGYTRRKAGKGFVYLDPQGARVDDPDTLERLKALVLPPAWTEVWICPRENGHLQAVGTDAAGRRQYRYHEKWTQRRSRAKFDRMLQFAEVLPPTRAACAELLTAEDQPTRDLVLSAAIRLLDLGLFRVGGETYASENESYGLATVRREHVQVVADRMRFEYPAKSGVQRSTEITSAPLAEIVRRLKNRRGGGDELLAYKAGGRWRDVTSADINARLKELAGSDYSAKDFRTWNATVLGGVALAARADSAGRKVAATHTRRAEAAAVREVAEVVGNTPTVCRSSYLDPRLFDRFRTGHVVETEAESLEEVIHLAEPERHQLEANVLTFLGK